MGSPTLAGDGPVGAGVADAAADAVATVDTAGAALVGAVADVAGDDFDSPDLHEAAKERHAMATTTREALMTAEHSRVHARAGAP